MDKVNSYINPSPRTTKTLGDVALPFIWGNDFVTHESGVILNDTGLGADKVVRGGSILVKDAGNAGQWRLVADQTALEAATEVVILKAAADLTNGAGKVGVWLRGGFIAGRMPSVADNSVMGLESAARAELITHGFKFAEDY